MLGVLLRACRCHCSEHEAGTSAGKLPEERDRLVERVVAKLFSRIFADSIGDERRQALNLQHKPIPVERRPGALFQNLQIARPKIPGIDEQSDLLKGATAKQVGGRLRGRWRSTRNQQDRRESQ